MNVLFDLGFTGDVRYVTGCIVYIGLYIAGAMLLYLSVILISEVFYFIYCKLKQQSFDYKEVLYVLTDLEDDST
ncbi:MAG: hypothetical protein IJE43_19610 [Alphaproteobacteria bacterium]|nr:hypothetical protein [Alphaproteobacteria bacterium]